MNNEVQFIDTSKECIQLMKKMARQGLMKAGKKINKKIKSQLPVKSGSLKKSVFAKVLFDKTTGIPELDVGYRSKKKMEKMGIKHWVNPWWFEFGISPHEISTKEVQNNSSKRTYKLKDYRGIEFGYTVKHPGMPAKNFLRSTVYDNIQEINTIIEEEFKKITDYQIEQGMNIDIGGDEEID